MTFRFQHFITPLGTKEFAKVVRAEGIYIFDNLGRRLLDGSSGAVSVNIGHAHPKVLAAMRAQMDEYLFTHCMRWENEPNVRLAERIDRMSGWGFDAVYFLSGGSEANEAALKFARQVALSRGEASRWKIVSRMPSYHGATTALLGIVGDPDYSRPFEPMFVKNPKVDAPLLYRRPAGETPDDVVDRCLRQLEETIEREDPSTVLAFMIEPVGGVSTGCLVAPDRYMTGIRRICDRYGILLIFDEIMSGAGRTGRFLAAQHWPDCRPDIVTLAKGVSGSYAPLGAVLTSSALMESVRRARRLQARPHLRGEPDELRRLGRRPRRRRGGGADGAGDRARRPPEGRTRGAAVAADRRRARHRPADRRRDRRRPRQQGDLPGRSAGERADRHALPRARAAAVLAAHRRRRQR
jgi:adenosylmethionine-8-amino-7-oxononanoate aminotransferase